MSFVSNPKASLTVDRPDQRVLAGIGACALLTALAARMAFPVPFTPVPVTLQVAAVLLSGLLLGARGGLTAQALYLLAGLAGAPVFAFGNGGAHYLLNAHGTGGYLLSYPLAAALVGYLAQRRSGKPSDSRSNNDFNTSLVACAAGLAVIYGIGCLWFGLWLHLSILQTLMQGAGWFLAWDMVKALVAILVAQASARGVLKSGSI